MKTKTGGLLTKTELTDVKYSAIHTLKSLVKPYGIYASGVGDWDDGYHHFFGRDSAITAIFILESEKMTGEYMLSPKAFQALGAIAKYQGKQDNNFTGEEVGKIPHEINTDVAHVKSFCKKITQTDGKTWFVDPGDGCLKNWDSVDSTPLWILAVGKYIDEGWQLPKTMQSSLSQATVWIIDNLERFDGFIGWIPARQQPHRKYGGLQNQSWKDSYSPYVYLNSRQATYPIHDVFSNAAAFAALRYAAVILKKSDPDLSKQAAKAAKKLKKNFNRVKNGFRNPKNQYFADALDAGLKQLKTPSIDVAMCLGADFRGEVVISRFYIHNVVNRLISDEFTDTNLGVRTYSRYIKNYQINDQYHRGPETYWPYAGLFVAQGLERQGYKIAAEKIMRSTLNGLSNFNSFIELFVKKGGRVELWHNSTSPQTSTTTQAWTAAGAYYAANYLLNNRSAFLPVDIPVVSQAKSLLINTQIFNFTR